MTPIQEYICTHSIMIDVMINKFPRDISFVNGFINARPSHCYLRHKCLFLASHSDCFIKLIYIHRCQNPPDTSHITHQDSSYYRQFWSSLPFFLRYEGLGFSLILIPRCLCPTPLFFSVWAIILLTNCSIRLDDKPARKQLCFYILSSCYNKHRKNISTTCVHGIDCEPMK